MGVIIGWNTTKLKSLTANESGLKLESGTTIEIHQRAFHICYIPCFPMGKVFGLKKGNELFELSPEKESIVRWYLDQNGTKPKTPLYTFAFPILLIIVSIGFIVSNVSDDINHNSFMKKERSYFIENIKKEINEITPNHYIKLESINTKYIQLLYLKIIKVNKDNLILSIYESEEDLSEYDKLLPNELISIFKSDTNFKTITIPKKQLAQASCENFYSKNIKECNTYISINNDKYYVNDIYYINEHTPMLVYDYYFTSKWDFTNYGAPFTITKISGEKNYSFKQELPLTLNYGDKLKDIGDGVKNNKSPFEVVLHLTDTFNKKYQLKIHAKSKEHHSRIERFNGF